MTLLLRIAALLCCAWAVSLPVLTRLAAVDSGGASVPVALGDALAVANGAFAYLFWHAAARAGDERDAIYLALVLFGLRAACGTYQVLYLVEGRAAVLSLIDMVTSLALFVGVLNTLPGYLKSGRRGHEEPPGDGPDRGG
jgi:hypothetical protein